jgi:hypothetical protein
MTRVPMSAGSPAGPEQSSRRVGRGLQEPGDGSGPVVAQQPRLVLGFLCRKLAAFERFVDALAALASKADEAPAGRGDDTRKKAVALR